MDNRTELQKKFEEQTPTIKGVSNVEYLQTYCSWLEFQINKTTLITNYDGKKLPDRVFLGNIEYIGRTAFINGYNGYTKTLDDGLLCAIIDGSCWTEGKPNKLSDKEGNFIHSENRRGVCTYYLTKKSLNKTGENLYNKI